MRENKGNKLLNLVNDYIMLDIETTGFSPQNDEIIEIAAIKVRNDIIIDEFQVLINPNVKIPSNITNLTGITNEMIQEEGINYKTALSFFYDFIDNDILVAHNANFDINFLYDKFEFYIDSQLTNDFIDTMEISRKLLPDLPTHKLSTLAKYFNIDYTNAHRGLNDVKITFELYNILKNLKQSEYEQPISKIFENIVSCSDYNNKKVIVKTKLKKLDYDTIETILLKCNSKVYPMLYTFCDYLIINDDTYIKYKNIDSETVHLGKWLHTAKKLEDKGSLTVVCESDFCKSFNIPYFRKINIKKEKVSAKNIFPETQEFNTAHPLYNKKCVFTGSLEKIERKKAMQLVTNLGGICQDKVTMETNYLILGNNHLSHNMTSEKSSKQQKAEALNQKGKDIKIISEDIFYNMIFENNNIK